MLYDSVNNRRITLVDGSTKVPLYASDGSYNCILNSSGTGLYHPSGAHRVTNSANPYGLNQAPDGSLYTDGSVLTSLGGVSTNTKALLSGVYTLSGNAIGMYKTTIMSADFGSYAWAGIDANLVKQAGGTLAASQGTYSLTGISSGLYKGYSFPSDLGTFSFSGVSTNLSKGSTVVASQGTYALTGVSAGTLKGSVTPSSQGTYTLTGVDAALTKSSGGPSAFTMTDVTNNSYFQRNASTTGPVYSSGTYTGTAPNNIQLQVRRTSDNAIVQAWTNATSQTISGGNWSCRLDGVAVSPNTSAGAYIVEARPANATGLAVTGTNVFRIGIGILCVGQSNMNYMFSVANSPATAGTGTGYYDVTSGWTSVPAAEGVRQLLNGVATNTSISCFAVNTSKPGTPLYYLRPGNPGSDSDWWNNNTAPQLTAVRDMEIIAIDHGEANASEGTTGSSYSSQLDGYHGELATAVGRTKTTMPMLVALLGQQLTAYSGTSDASWEVINRSLYAAATGGLTGVSLSHSNIDFPINNGDGFGVHYGYASYAKQGDRFARSIATKLGYTSGYPYFTITGSATVDATHTDVTVTHILGTDFTPTSAITGFTVSDDAFATTVTPTAAVRTSATTIRLTHSSLSTGSTRKLRYMYGGGSPATAPVVDNSSLAVPLVQAMAELSPTPLAASPVATYVGTQSTSSGSTTQTTPSFTPTSGAGLDLYIAVKCAYSPPSSVTFNPTGGGTSKTASSPLIVTSGSDRVTAWFHVTMDSVPTSYTVDVGWASAPFTYCVVDGVQVANLTSGTPIDSAQSESYPTNTTTRTVTLNVTAGSVILVAGETGDGTSNTDATITGTETFVKHNQTYYFGTNGVVGSKSGAAANASSSVTVTFPSGGGSPVSLAAIALH